MAFKFVLICTEDDGPRYDRQLQPAAGGLVNTSDEFLVQFWESNIEHWSRSFIECSSTTSSICHGILPFPVA